MLRAWLPPALSYKAQAATLRFCSNDDALNCADKCLKRANRRLVRENRHVTEHYVEAELEIRIKCSPGFNASDYDLVFSFIPSGWRPEWEIHSSPAFLGRLEYAGPGELHRPSRRPNRENNRVFVAYTELVQSPKAALPSFVRLEFPKKVTDLTGDVLTPTANSIFNVFCRFSEREGRFLQPWLLRNESSRVSGLIKGGPKVVDSISGEVPDFVGHFLEELEFMKLCRFIRVHLNDSGVWLALEESCTLSVHVTEMALCVRDSAFWAVEGVIRGICHGAGHHRRVGFRSMGRTRARGPEIFFPGKSFRGLLDAVDP
jgi:hypothetical protein